MAIHKHFDKICELRGLWPAEIARRLGINQGVVTRLRQGTTDPQLELVRKLARLLDVTIDYLSGEKGERAPTKAELAVEALELYLRTAKLPLDTRRGLERIAADPSSPKTLQEWKDHMDRGALSKEPVE